MSNVASTLLPFLATMSKQRSTLLPKTATMSSEFCVEISSFRQSRTLLRHCCPKRQHCRSNRQQSCLLLRQCRFDIVASVDRALHVSYCSYFHAVWAQRQAAGECEPKYAAEERWRLRCLELGRLTSFSRRHGGKAGRRRKIIRHTSLWTEAVWRSSHGA